MTLELLHQDERLVVVAKPPGLLVHRTRESRDRVFLVQELAAQLGRWPFPVHRLDRATSGAIVFALSSSDAAALQAALSADSARKEYRVLVRGRTPPHFESRRPLSNAKGVPQEAWTEFETLGEVARCSLLRARIHTGRRHQIRRHLAHLAHHVIGDTRYGKGRINRALRESHGLPRQFVHARTLEFVHPGSLQPLRVECPLAADLRAFLEALPGASPELLSLA